MAVMTFLGGSVLEMFDEPLLAAHPYWGNLLSGMTGFASSGFVVSVVLRRMQVSKQRQEFLRGIQPELDGAAGRIASEVERILRFARFGVDLPPEADPVGVLDQDRVFQVVAAAPGHIPFGEVVPALASAVGRVTDQFGQLQRLERIVVQCLADQRPRAIDSLATVNTAAAANSWFWRITAVPKEVVGEILETVTALAESVGTLGLLDLPGGRGIGDALGVARARAEALRTDPEPGAALSDALITLARIVSGLPLTSVSPTVVTRLVRHCADVTFRSLQLCADLIVAWALMRDGTRHPGLEQKVRTALATMIIGTDTRLVTALPPMQTPGSALDDLFQGITARVPSAPGEQLVDEWYRRHGARPS